MHWEFRRHLQQALNFDARLSTTANWLAYLTGNVERFHDRERTSAIHHIGYIRAAQTAAARRWRAADCYCFILGNVHERIRDVREKASAAAAGC